MTKVLLDTDILSEVMKAKNLEVQRNANQYLEFFGRFTVSVITITEIVRGFQKSQEEQRLRSFIAFLEENNILQLGVEEAALAGKIAGDLERTGKSIGHMDPFIASTAIIHKMPLVTGNARHFVRVVELGYPLELQNWRIPNG
jgi:tRNA(fMet)-specific endonuclease VapC